MIAYINGKFIPKDRIAISPEDRGFLFADGAYEVICSYNGNLFKIDEHLERLRRSLGELRIEGPPINHLRTVAEGLIERNELSDVHAMIYIQVTRGAAPRKHIFPEKATPATVYANASAFQPLYKERENGITVITLPDIRWDRCDIKSVALLPNVLACQQAKERGAVEAVFIRNGFITEGSHTNFCAVFDDQLFTHPANNHILGGITRQVVLGLCTQLGVPFKESPILENELKNADEAMVLGTTYEILPVVQVDDWQVGNGTPGPITRELQHAYRRATTS
ncbi:MAG: D-amino-acid transaminase [Desulfobacterales bacterium]|nr:MAG: D-amino-acid transaminase [Desulfobacterales bacterium]